MAGGCRTARGLVNLEMLPVRKQSGTFDFVTGTQNGITKDYMEESALDNVDGA